MKQIDLLPCPFCGTLKPEIWEHDGLWHIKCVNGCGINIRDYVSRSAAEKAWNNRQATPAITPPHLYPQCTCDIDSSHPGEEHANDCPLHKIEDIVREAEKNISHGYAFR